MAQLVAVIPRIASVTAHGITQGAASRKDKRSKPALECHVADRGVTIEHWSSAQIEEEVLPRDGGRRPRRPRTGGQGKTSSW